MLSPYPQPPHSDINNNNGVSRVPVISREVRFLPLLLLECAMILVFFYAYLLLSCLPVLRSAITNTSMPPNCRNSFGCPGLGHFKYPFYNDTDTQCGLIKINCTSKGGKIQLGGQWYEISAKIDYSQFQSSGNILIYNRTFEDLVRSKSCAALANNFTSPSPLLYSISIAPPFITLFKCSNNLTSADAYFKQHHYSSYKSCKHHNFYYNYLNGTLPYDLPLKCQVVHLPKKDSSRSGLDEANIFSLISSFPSISISLSDSCSECHKNGSRCDAKNEQFQCLEVIKENQAIGQTQIKILVIGVPITVLMLIFIFFIIWRHYKRNPFSYVSSKNTSQNLEDISSPCGVSVFSYKELEDATHNFDPSNELGDGGFGAVYYGKLQDGREVAVKKLHEHNYKRVQQFINEVEILTKLRHPNLVVLYGCTSSQSRELLLVYEYVPNGTVTDHLHGEQASPNLLPWRVRMNIAIETASALAYLHASEIIHRDVKTNNILLDLNFSVKVADFGLSRLIPNNLTHISTAPQGTPGYVDPQYHTRYQLTDKSDVYSFGVVLIELISSMMAVDLNRDQDEISLANLALNRIQKCAIDELIDPALGSDTNPEIRNMITVVAELAFRCLQYDSEMRPTMNEVVDTLKEIQAAGRIDDFEKVNLLPLSETNDAVVLLKDFLRLPASVTGESQSSNSVSTTVSSNGERLSVKNGES